MRVSFFAALLTGALAAPVAARHSAGSRHVEAGHRRGCGHALRLAQPPRLHGSACGGARRPGARARDRGRRELRPAAAGLTPAAVAIGEHVIVRGNPSRGDRLMVLGRELRESGWLVLPLNIRSAPSRAAPQNVLATSIAGTSFRRPQGFYGYTESRAKWTLTGRAQEEAAAWSSRSASILCAERTSDCFSLQNAVLRQPRVLPIASPSATSQQQETRDPDGQPNRCMVIVLLLAGCGGGGGDDARRRIARQ